MAQNWRYSSARRGRELGYRPRTLDTTLRDTVDWYLALIDVGRAGSGAAEPLSLAATGMRLAGRAGLLGGVRLAERYVGAATGRGRLSGDGFFPRDEYFMRLALREAERALEHDDVPVGCVIAAGGEVVAAAPNERELREDPTAHCRDHRAARGRRRAWAAGGWTAP